MISAGYMREHHGEKLRGRLREERKFIQILWGARQVGKTTLALQVAEQVGIPFEYVVADAGKTNTWLELQWHNARRTCAQSPKGALLIIDEIQKIPEWSETVKYLWDEDAAAATPLKVLLLGSAQVLIRGGLAESMLGRYEMIYLPHWSLQEMRDAFGFTLSDYLVFGGYPGGASLRADPTRWDTYIRESILEAAISTDLAQLSAIRKPALMHQLTDLAFEYSGKILSYNKMLGQLQDAGNTTTLAGYYELLQQLALAMPLEKYASALIRQRKTTPKHQVLNNALKTFVRGSKWWQRQVHDESERFGELVESAVGAHLANAHLAGQYKLYYWRHNNDEVDFILTTSDRILAIEVTTSQRHTLKGLDAFKSRFKATDRKITPMLVGPGGIELDELLSTPVTKLLA